MYVEPTAATCPVWCADCSRDADHLVDRTHFSSTTIIEIELEKRVERGLRDPHEPETLQLNLRQNVREIEPRISVGKGESVGVDLTLAEAIQVAEKLRRLVEAAGQVRDSE